MGLSSPKLPDAAPLAAAAPPKPLETVEEIKLAETAEASLFTAAGSSTGLLSALRIPLAPGL